MLSSILQVGKLKLRNFNHLFVVIRANNYIQILHCLPPLPSKLWDLRRQDPVLSQGRNLGTSALSKGLLNKWANAWMNEHNRLWVGPGLARSWPSSLCVLRKVEKKNWRMKICDFSGLLAMLRVPERVGFHNRLTSIFRGSSMLCMTCWLLLEPSPIAYPDLFHSQSWYVSAMSF